MNHDRIDPDFVIDPSGMLDEDPKHNYAPVADEEDIRCVWCDSRPGSPGLCGGPGVMADFSPKEVPTEG